MIPFFPSAEEKETCLCSCFPAEKCSFPQKDVSRSIHHCSTCVRKIFGGCAPDLFENNLPVKCRYCHDLVISLENDGASELQAPKLVKIVIMEDVKLFDEKHPHYGNGPVFTSSNDTHHFLVSMISKQGIEANSTHAFNFNGKEIFFTQEKSEGHRSNGTFAFECVKGKFGYFDDRIYYGYDKLIGYTSNFTKKGYICPSMVVQIEANGEHRDSGLRILAIMRTRCSAPVYHALVYSAITEKFELLRHFINRFNRGNMYTVWHVPFTYDGAIQRLVDSYFEFLYH